MKKKGKMKAKAKPTTKRTGPNTVKSFFVVNANTVMPMTMPAVQTAAAVTTLGSYWAAMKPTIVDRQRVKIVTKMELRGTILPRRQQRRRMAVRKYPTLAPIMIPRLA